MRSRAAFAAGQEASTSGLDEAYVDLALSLAACYSLLAVHSNPAASRLQSDGLLRPCGVQSRTERRVALPGALLSSSGASKPRAMRWPMAFTIPERTGYALQPRCGTSRLTCAPTVRGSLRQPHEAVQKHTSYIKPREDRMTPCRLPSAVPGPHTNASLWHVNGRTCLPARR